MPQGKKRCKGCRGCQGLFWAMLLFNWLWRWTGHETRDVRCFLSFNEDNEASSVVSFRIVPNVFEMWSSCCMSCWTDAGLSVRNCITPNDVGSLHTFLRVQHTPARHPKMHADVHWSMMNCGITGQANLNRLDDVLQVLGSGLGSLCAQKDLGVLVATRSCSCSQTLVDHLYMADCSCLDSAPKTL